MIHSGLRGHNIRVPVPAFSTLLPQRLSYGTIRANALPVLTDRTGAAKLKTNLPPR